MPPPDGPGPGEVDDPPMYFPEAADSVRLPLPSSQEIATRVPSAVIVRNVPAKAKPHVVNAMVWILQRTSAQRSHEFKLFAMFPRMILSRSFDTPGSMYQIIMDRLALFREGRYAELWEASLADDVKRGTQRREQPDSFLSAEPMWSEACLRGLNLDTAVDEESLSPLVLARATKLTGMAFYSRASAALSAAQIAPTSEHNADILREKHPQHAPPEVADDMPADRRPQQVTARDVRNALNQFPKGSGSGLSGWTPDLLLQLTRTPDSRLLDHLPAFINRFIGCREGDVIHDDVRSLYFGALLCALFKKDGTLRPIASGDVFRRIAGKIQAHRTRQAALAYLIKRRQVGVALPSGADIMAFSARRYAAKLVETGDTSKIVFKIDLRNAYNEVSRKVLLEECKLHFPQLFRYAFAAYGAHTWLVFGEHILSSEVGVQQGDPLGSLLFCLVLGLLRDRALADPSCPADFSLDLEAWYIDDGCIGGLPEHIRWFLNFIEVEGVAMGIFLNRAKCERISLNVEDTDLFPGVPWLPLTDFPLLGVPCGDRASAVRWAELVLARAAVKTRCLACVPDPHKAFHLLRFCGGFSLVAFLLRHVGYIPALEDYDRNLRLAAERILGPNDEFQWRQVTLPVRYWGFGLRACAPHASAAIAAAASIAFKHEALLVSDPARYLTTQMSLLTPALQDDPRYNDTSAAFSLSHDPVRAVVACIARGALNEIGNKKLQSELSDGIEKAAREGLLADLRTAGKLDDVRRLEAWIGDNKGTGSWLCLVADAADGPLSRQFSLWLSSAQFNAAANFRLGKPVAPIESPCVLCRGKKVADVMGYHSLVCMSGGDRARASANICALIGALCRYSGFQVSPQPFPFPENGLRPDLQVSMGNRIWLIDFALSHRYIGDPTGYEQSKVNHYQPSIDRAARRHQYFTLVPFIADSFGALSVSALGFIKVMSDAYARRFDVQLRIRAQQMITQCIGATVVREVARILLRNADPEEAGLLDALGSFGPRRAPVIRPEVPQVDPDINSRLAMAGFLAASAAAARDRAARVLRRPTAPRPRSRLPRVLPSAATAQVNGVEASVGAEAGPVDSDGHLSASTGSSDESSSSAGSDNDDDVGGSVAWTPRPVAVPIVAPRSRGEAAASSRAQSEGRAALGPPPSPPLRQVRSDHLDIRADPEHPFPHTEFGDFLRAPSRGAGVAPGAGSDCDDDEPRIAAVVTAGRGSDGTAAAVAGRAVPVSLSPTPPPPPPPRRPSQTETLDVAEGVEVCGDPMGTPDFAVGNTPPAYAQYLAEVRLGHELRRVAANINNNTTDAGAVAGVVTPSPVAAVVTPVIVPCSARVVDDRSASAVLRNSNTTTNNNNDNSRSSRPAMEAAVDCDASDSDDSSFQIPDWGDDDDETRDVASTVDCGLSAASPPARITSSRPR